MRRAFPVPRLTCLPAFLIACAPLPAERPLDAPSTLKADAGRPPPKTDGRLETADGLSDPPALDGPPRAAQDTASPADAVARDVAPSDTRPPTTGTPPAADAEAPGSWTACRGEKFCMDFEDQTAGGAPVNPAIEYDRGGGSIVVDESRAFSGRRSVRVQMARADNRHMLKVPKALLPNPPRKSMYVRMMMWLDVTPRMEGVGHWDVFGFNTQITAAGRTGEGRVSFGGSHEDRSRLIYRWLVDGGSDCPVRPPHPLPTKQWLCLTLKADEADPNQHYRVQVNGVTMPMLDFVDGPPGSTCGQTLKGKWPVGEYDSAFFGWRQAHTRTNDVTYWMDDIAVDDKPIPCPTPAPPVPWAK